jgi:hypothetical protein
VAERLAEHLRAGTRLDLLPDVPESPDRLAAEVMRGWGPDHGIEASALRDLLRGRTVADPDPRGIRVRGARIRDRLDLRLLTSSVALELVDCLIEDGIDAIGARLAGIRLLRCRLGGVGLRLDDARVSGTVSLRGSVLRTDTGPALGATGLRTDGDLQLTGGFVARGPVLLVGARIGADLDCAGARLADPAGTALDAHRVQVAGEVRLDGVLATGSVRLADATVGGRVGAAAAVLTAVDEPAFALDRASVAGNVHLNRGFRAEGGGPAGAVRLVGTRIAGRLNCATATMRNPTGPGLAADGLQVGGDAVLGDGLVVDGAGPRGAVRLPGAQVGGELHCAGATVTHRSDPTLRWLVDGLRYRGVPRVDPDGRHRGAWLALLRTATPGYAAQPYQQLAAGYRGEGHDADARAVLMRQRRDQLDRGALTRRGDRAWARLTGVLLGYGYQPWRALIGLAAVLAVSVTLALALGAAGGLDRPADPPPPAPAAAPRVPCTAVQTVAVGLDLGTPFLPAARGGSCEATTDPAGAALTVARWVLQLAAWALAALFVAGFTGIVRRT